MKTILAKSIFLIIPFLALVQISCRSAPDFNIYGLNMVHDKGLDQAIRDYYSSEHIHDWKSTYAYRSSKFRNLVSFDIYIKSMRNSFRGWEMQEVQVESSSCYLAECKVRIKFRARVDRDISKKYSKGFAEVLTHTEDTLWHRVENRWFVIDAGVRGHIPLNANLADN